MNKQISYLLLLCININKKELREFKAILKKQRETVSSSKKAAKELLTQLGMLTPKGNFKKSFRPTADRCHH